MATNISETKPHTSSSPIHVENGLTGRRTCKRHARLGYTGLWWVTLTPVISCTFGRTYDAGPNLLSNLDAPTYAASASAYTAIVMDNKLSERRHACCPNLAFALVIYRPARSRDDGLTTRTDPNSDVRIDREYNNRIHSLWPPATSDRRRCTHITNVVAVM